MTFTARELPLSRMLRELRERRGLSQRELAAVLRGLTGRERLQRGEVSRWERGARVPTPRWLAWLAVALDAPLTELDVARREQLFHQQGNDAESARRTGAPGPARLLGAAEQVGTRFRDTGGHVVLDANEVDDLREAIRQVRLPRGRDSDDDEHLWPDGEVRVQPSVTDESDGTMLSLSRVTRPAEPTAGRRLADVLGWDQVPQLSAEDRREADEEFADAQARARRTYELDMPAAGSTDAEPWRTRVHPHTGPDIPVRLAGHEFAASVAAVVANRDDIRWLKGAVQALLNHRGIGGDADADEAHDRGTDTAPGQTQEVIRAPRREDIPSEANE
jgi:transcriptional regulator with XRE-family HTH domain